MNSFSRNPSSDSRWGVIENQARFLQLELWNSRHVLWKGDVPRDPIDVLQPGVALRLKGFTVETVESLPDTIMHGKRFDVAGTIDRAQKIVQISNRPSKPVQLFTAAHELGHAVLHPDGVSVHRDIPLEVVGWRKDPEEREADWFATCFQMPAKQVRSVFQALFLADQFVLTEKTAFALCTKPYDVVASKFRAVRDLSLAVVRATTYAGQPIPQLHKIFRVSAEAMAIRLDQLQLVADPQLGRRSA
ncbi:MAG TPA: ImmA/IrrE family metallo-endopeptidase [Rhodanobacteraceae bacterium]|nr:ImmA/IrrE family metallo-endopeptidase [Rhodanobacteraceae bacterium]